jgi:ABC-type transport system involved in multi-copper enzyme maturation permease subunit
MNQIVHIFRKDCRRLWQIIAAVLVFTFLHGYGDATNLGGGVAIGLSPYALVFILISLSGLLLPVLLVLLIVSVIQEESLVGSDKFWLTRPYNRRSLALEKFLFVVLWAILPMLLHDVVLIRHFGFSLSSAFGLLLWKYVQFGFFLLAAATLAVLSDRRSQREPSPQRPLLPQKLAFWAPC